MKIAARRTERFLSFIVILLCFLSTTTSNAEHDQSFSEEAALDEKKLKAAEENRRIKKVFTEIDEKNKNMYRYIFKLNEKYIHDNVKEKMKILYNILKPIYFDKYTDIITVYNQIINLFWKDNFTNKEIIFINKILKYFILIYYEI